MKSVEESIDVNVDVRTAYNQWTQFESFPHFMEGVKKVVQLDDRHLRWVTEVSGETKEWDAEITEQIPDQRIAWTSITGSPNSGLVTFQALGESLTRVTVRMDYKPEGFVESAGSAFGIVGGQVRDDLERFKEYIERRGMETGGWRGEIAV